MKSNHPITSRKTTCSWKKSGGTMPSVTRHRNSRERARRNFFSVFSPAKQHSFEISVWVNIGGALRDIQKKKTRLQMRLTINPFYFALFSVTSNSVISNSSLFPTDLFVVLGKMFPQLTMQSRYPLLHPYLNNFTFIAIQQ